MSQLSTAMEDAIQGWVASASGLTAIWADQGGHRPEAPYVSLSILSLDPVGPDWTTHEFTAFAFDDIAVDSVDSGADVITTDDPHGLHDGDGPIEIETTGTMPDPLLEDVGYWVIEGPDETTLQVAASFEDAMAGTFIPLTSDGTGDLTIVSSGETMKHGAEVTHASRGSRKMVVTIQCFAADATGPTQSVGILGDVVAKVSLPSNKNRLRPVGLSVPSFGAIVKSGGAINSAHYEPRAIVQATFFIASEVTETGTIIERVEKTEQITLP